MIKDFRILRDGNDLSKFQEMSVYTKIPGQIIPCYKAVFNMNGSTYKMLLPKAQVRSMEKFMRGRYFKSEGQFWRLLNYRFDYWNRIYSTTRYYWEPRTTEDNLYI